MDHPVLNHKFAPNGNAPTVLYLHGFLGCGDDWNEIVNHLGGDFSHLTVNLPGHRTPPHDLPSECYSMSGCAGLIVSLLDHLRIGPCHLVAYSMGGRLALYLLTHYPDRFLSAVIESASPGLKTEAERDARKQRDQLWIEQLGKRPIEEFIYEWYAQPIFNTINRTSAQFEKMMRRRQQHSPEALALSLEHMGTGVMSPLWDSLPGLSTPLLLVAGERDEKYRTLAHEMANLCPRWQVAIIPGAGHNVHFECPEAFGEAVVQFLKQDS